MKQTTVYLIYGLITNFPLMIVNTHLLYCDTVESTFLNYVHLGLSNLLKLFSWSHPEQDWLQ